MLEMSVKCEPHPISYVIFLLRERGKPWGLSHGIMVLKVATQCTMKDLTPNFPHGTRPHYRIIFFGQN